MPIAARVANRSRLSYFLSLSGWSKVAVETGLNWSEIIVLASGLILAIGAIGEYLEEHGKLPRWTKAPFIFMVALSLIGEFVGDAGVYKFSSRLQVISDEELSKTERDARDANDRATTAYTRAETAISRLDPRVNFAFKFLYELSGAPKAKAVIWYMPSKDNGAFFLSETIRNLLASAEPNGAGWSAIEPVPILPGRDPNLGDVGVLYSSKLPVVCPPVPPNSCAALIAALGTSLLSGITSGQSDVLAEDTFLIVVKRRPEGTPAPFAPIPFSPPSKQNAK